jgi:hypothetical protein
MIRIAPRVADVEGVEWTYADVARELQDLEVDDVDGIALESAAGPGREDEVADDEIGRASEELQSDEG